MEQATPDSYEEAYFNSESKDEQRRPRKLVFRDGPPEKEPYERKYRKPRQPRGRHHEPSSPGNP